MRTGPAGSAADKERRSEGINFSIGNRRQRAARPSQKKACVRRGAMLPFRHIADKESTQGGVQLRPVELGSHPRGFGDPGVEEKHEDCDSH